MLTLKGRAVFEGIAVGEISLLRREEKIIKRSTDKDPEAEIRRFQAAAAEAASQLEQLHSEAVVRVGEAEAEIFNIHRMMLDDLDFRDSAENIIKTEAVNAEYAVAVAADNFSAMFSAMEDEYMKQRAADVKDIANRLISILTSSADTARRTVPSVIAADDLMPSETVQLDKDSVLAFITERGSLNSHTAILARTMNIPAIVSVGSFPENIDGMLCVVDGFTGTAYIDPDTETLARMNEKKRRHDETRALLLNLRGLESVTLDGKHINVFANIGGLGDVGEVLKNDADGVGLFRSEFLYLEKNDFPTEEEQFAVYKAAAQNLAGKRLIIRTLDIGADKQADYFGLDREENPALGYRAVRICLDRPDIFKTQLRAILRASAYGSVSIMVPMIISLNEVLRVKQILNEAREELKGDGISYSEELEFGIMIETPAAAIISDTLAREVDFFSLGTNDLTQYILAADRQNPRLDTIADPHHPALLRLIKTVAENAHAANKWVGICGELAADLSLTDFFLSIGIDELSVSCSSILRLRKKIRETDISALPKKIIADRLL